jgi:two-component system, OmpR family, sensor histidine kinase MprB
MSTSHKTRGQRLRERYSPRRLFNWRTFRSRITVLVMLAVGLSVAIGALISYLSISKAINNNVDNDLKHRTAILADTSLADPAYFTANALTAANCALTLSMSGLQETILNADGSSVKPNNIKIGNSMITTQAPWGQPELEVAQGTLPYSLRTIDENGQAYRVYAVPDRVTGQFGALAPDSALVISVSLASTENTLSTLTSVSIIVGLIGIALAGAAGFAIGRAALRPVEELSRATEYIARTGDLRSLTVIGDDELAQLTRNFNTMLEALARSQEHQKRLVADAGHELRTPLTSMRTNLDLLAQVMAVPNDGRMSPEDRVDLMNDVRAQMEELSALISDLVELSRDEQPSHAIEHVDLRDIVDRAAERVQRRAPALTYDLRLSPWYLDGDPAALERLITNLMDNAAKWSPEGGTVTVTLADGLLQVADQGPGIAEEDLTHVFERFYRSPEARATPGSGLGLAIVRQIAENHGGRVAAARAQGGGALLGVWLPGTSVAGELPVGVR